MDRPDIETLLNACRSGEPSQQVTAILALRNMKASAAVPVLLTLLSSPDTTVRTIAVQALGYLGASEASTVAPALLHLVNDRESLIRSEVVDALSRLRYTPAIEQIKRLLRNDSDALVRASAAEALGDLGDSSALVDLEAALLDPDEAVRAYAALAIGLLTTPEFLQQLERYLSSEQSLHVKAELLGASYRLGKREALKQMLGLLSNADETLVTIILNILTDFTERQVPTTLVSDAPLIYGALAMLRQNTPILNHHIEEIIANLSKLGVNLS